MLTTALDQAYPFTATAKSVVGIGVLSGAAISRKRSAVRLFYCLSVLKVYGRTGRGAARLAGAPPVCQPVQFRPPRLASGGAVR